MPCWRLFDQQDGDWKDQVLGPREAVHLAVEALSPLGWERYVGRDGLILGIDSFGASGPAADVTRHFGMTAERIAEMVMAELARC